MPESPYLTCIFLLSSLKAGLFSCAINPPTPETFFASDFDDFCKYGSHATLEKGKGRK